MKKSKSIICIALLSVFLAGNVFAGNTVGNGVFSFFDNLVSTVVSLVSQGEDCPPRQCTNCKPEERDGDGNCRPTSN